MADTLPSEVTFVESTPTETSQSGQDLTWNLGDIASDAFEIITVTVTINEGVLANTTISNIANVTSDTEDPNPGDEETDPPADVEVVPPGTLADLSITKIVNATSASVGDSILYTINVTNNGPDAAQNVIVADTLPSEVTYVSDTDTCVEAPSGTLICSLGDIANGNSISFDITVNATSVGKATNQATVDSDTNDPNEDNNTTESDPTKILPDGTPPNDKNITRGDNQWDTRPTFGINHETRETILVENGFTFNGESLTINDNHHTPFDQKSINIGTVNTFAAKVYASKVLKVQEFLFGVPEIGMGHQAEMRIEVWYNFDGEIEDVKVIQESDVVDAASVSVTHKKIKCLEIDLEEKCDSTLLSAIFLEPLKDEVMAIKAMDFKLRDHTTYLNEGFDITGESLNPMSTSLIPSDIKYEGLLLVTQTAKYSKYWVAEDGRTFERNDFGSFREIGITFERFQDTGTAYTRLHSGFVGIIEYEQKRASSVFDSSQLISELPESFAYIYPNTHERIDDAMRQQMHIEEQMAKDHLEKTYLQARW